MNYEDILLHEHCPMCSTPMPVLPVGVVYIHPYCNSTMIREVKNSTPLIRNSNEDQSL